MRKPTAFTNQLKEVWENMELNVHENNTKQPHQVLGRHADENQDVSSKGREVPRVRTEDTTATNREGLTNVLKSNGGTSLHFNTLGLDDATIRYQMQMEQNTRKVKKSSDTLTSAEQLLNQADEMGGDALQKLRVQTETLHHINGATISVNDEISETRKILIGIEKKMVKHKVMLIGIIIVLVLLIFVALYVSTSKRAEQWSPQPSEHPTDIPQLPSWSPQPSGNLPAD